MTRAPRLLDLFRRRPKRGSGRFILRVSTSEASGPSGAGSRAEGKSRNARRDSGIKLTVPICNAVKPSAPGYAPITWTRCTGLPGHADDHRGPEFGCGITVSWPRAGQP